MPLRQCSVPLCKSVVGNMSSHLRMQHRGLTEVERHEFLKKSTTAISGNMINLNQVKVFTNLRTWIISTCCMQKISYFVQRLDIHNVCFIYLICFTFNVMGFHVKNVRYQLVYNTFLDLIKSALCCSVLCQILFLCRCRLEILHEKAEISF